MSESKENGCSFHVWAFVTDAGDDRDFVKHAEAMDKAIGEHWRQELRDHSYDPDNRRARTHFTPPDGEDEHGSIIVVCRTVRELMVCLLSMSKAGLYHPTVFASTEGFPTEATANVTLRLGEDGTYAQAAVPKDTPPLAGLYAANRLIEAEIRRLGGSRGF